MTVYRPFQSEDAEQVKAIALSSWQHTYRNIFDGPFITDFNEKNYSVDSLRAALPRMESGEEFFYVAIDGDSIVGFCNIGGRDAGMELYRIYLRPDYIGRGVGKTLLSLGEKFLELKGIDSYFCFVHERNEIGKAFYDRNGFRHIAEKDKDDEWYMEKKL